MTSVPEAPEAAAVYSLPPSGSRRHTNREINYVRIKILTEEGRKYADVEIPFFKDNVKTFKVESADHPAGRNHRELSKASRWNR